MSQSEDFIRSIQEWQVGEFRISLRNLNSKNEPKNTKRDGCWSICTAMLFTGARELPEEHWAKPGERLAPHEERSMIAGCRRNSVMTVNEKAAKQPGSPSFFRVCSMDLLRPQA